MSVTGARPDHWGDASGSWPHPAREPRSPLQPEWGTQGRAGLSCPFPDVICHHALNSTPRGRWGRWGGQPGGTSPPGCRPAGPSPRSPGGRCRQDWLCFFSSALGVCSGFLERPGHGSYRFHPVRGTPSSSSARPGCPCPLLPSIPAPERPPNRSLRGRQRCWLRAGGWRGPTLATGFPVCHHPAWPVSRGLLAGSAHLRGPGTPAAKVASKERSPLCLLSALPAGWNL